MHRATNTCVAVILACATLASASDGSPAVPGHAVGSQSFERTMHLAQWKNASSTVTTVASSGTLPCTRIRSRIQGSRTTCAPHSASRCPST